MKIILENELEKWAWGVMMGAHYKWEKNHGSVLQDQVYRWFEDWCREETEKAIKEEIERRLRDNFGDDYGMSKEEYVANGLARYDDFDLTGDEIKELEKELLDEYESLQKDIADVREDLTETVKDELRNTYYTFFNAPENLTVIYNDEVIQGK